MDKKHRSNSDEKLLKSLLKTGSQGSFEQHPKGKPGSSEKTSEFMRYLLLSGKELDLNKVLCLHLFAITVPPCPCQREESSHVIKEFTKYSLILPNYIVHNSDEDKLYCKCWYDENKDKIGKSRPCQIHLAVNVPIVEIIGTILEVLDKVNKFGFKKLVNLSHNLSGIMSCLLDKKYIDYIAGLHNTGILGDSKELRTEVCTVIKATKQFIEVAHIRKNMVLSLRAPEMFKILNNMFPNNLHGRSTLESIDSIKNDVHDDKVMSSKPMQIDDVSNSSVNTKEGNKEIKTKQKRLPHFYYPSVKRWPFTKKEVNINKELHNIKKINEKYIKKYINSREIKKTTESSTEKNELSDTIKKTLKTEGKTNITVGNDATEKYVKKNKNAKSSNKSFEDFLKIRHKAVSFDLKNEARLSQQNIEVKTDKSGIEKKLSTEVTNCSPSISEKNPLQLIDKNDLKYDLLKVELRSKLYQLISSAKDFIN